MKREPIRYPLPQRLTDERWGPPSHTIDIEANRDPQPVGVKLRNIRGQLTVRKRKAPPITLPAVSLSKPKRRGP